MCSGYSVCLTSQKCHVKKEIQKKYFCLVINPYFLSVSVSRTQTAYRNVTPFGLELTNHICTLAQEDPSSSLRMASCMPLFCPLAYFPGHSSFTRLQRRKAFKVFFSSRKFCLKWGLRKGARLQWFSKGRKSRESFAIFPLVWQQLAGQMVGLQLGTGTASIYFYARQKCQRCFWGRLELLLEVERGRLIFGCGEHLVMDMMICFEQSSTGTAIVTHARDCLLYIIPRFLLALLLKSLLQLSNFKFWLS